jgi:hypothetical protein
MHNALISVREMAMAEPRWSIKGPHVVNCNCEYGCPCQFNALPTYRTCVAIAAWKIEEGHFGDTRLDGLCAVNIWAWPGAVHEGDGSMLSVIDVRADAAQRKALAAILQGEEAEPGAVMLQIYRSMCAVYHEPQFEPIAFEIDVEGRTASLKVPGLIETVVEPIRNPVTGALHRARIDLPMGKEYHLSEVASGSTRAGGPVPLRFANRHAHLVYNTITSAGPLAA